MHGVSRVAVQKLIERGRLRTAVRIGSYWAIDADEPYPSDTRVKSGKYIGFRKPKDEQQ